MNEEMIKTIIAEAVANTMRNFYQQQRYQQQPQRQMQQNIGNPQQSQPQRPQQENARILSQIPQKISGLANKMLKQFQMAMKNGQPVNKYTAWQGAPEILRSIAQEIENNLGV